LFELLLPPGMRVLSGELAAVDRLLDDRRLFVPFRAFFDLTEGRPSIPIETYLRLMFLKFRYGLGYGRLCVEVGDSISWRRFCRIGLETSVPDESTIRKLTRCCGPELIEALNRELLAAADERGVVDVERVLARLRGLTNGPGEHTRIVNRRGTRSCRAEHVARGGCPPPAVSRRCWPVQGGRRGGSVGS
jgi:IS5 family transposase